MSSEARQRKMADRVKVIVAETLEMRIKDPRLGFITVTDVRVTPDLTVQFYAQPFVSTGDYSDVRELSVTPRAASYTARYRPYTPPANAGAEPGFQNWQLASNTVLRWEYRPGSTLFLVWSHNRNAYESTISNRGWRSEYGDLLGLHPANTLLIKVAYWINR